MESGVVGIELSGVRDGIVEIAEGGREGGRGWRGGLGCGIVLVRERRGGVLGMCAVERG